MIYFTVAFPYVVLIALMVNNAMLPGALEGIKYFIIPQWDRLLDVEVSKKKKRGNTPPQYYGISHLAWVSSVVSVVSVDEHSHVFQVWVNAAAQIFNSIGIGYGSFLAMSSYNSFNNNILR